ncbi:MAG TPA: hypothetical protein PKD90_10825 [Phnomibacter sp.]|nr:hypothetical protein [Phnomibacter sp.]
MRCTVLMLLALVCGTATNAQTYEHKKQPSFQLNFGLSDFQSAQNFRAGNARLGGKRLVNPNQMDPAFGLGYVQGLTNHFDIAATYLLSSTVYPYRDKPNTSFAGASILQEADVSLRMKLLSDNYAVVPYLQGGIGASAYRKKFDAFMPVGAGLQVRLGGHTFANANVQYRLPVTARANYHFVYTVGIISSIKSQK